MGDYAKPLNSPYRSSQKLHRDNALSEITSNATLLTSALTNLGGGSAATGTGAIAKATAPTIVSAVLTTPALTTPTTNTLSDTAGTVRLVPNPTAKTIVDGSATALFSVAVPALNSVGGVVHFHVRASDGTEFQADTGVLVYSAVAKTTTVVGTTTYTTAPEAKAVSSGTLTLAFTADVSVANVLTVKLQPTGSLTETTPYTIEYTLFPIRGVVTIL